jgi:ribonuclease P/MRP protein subunit RPP40
LTTQDLAKSLDSKSQVDMAIMDFSKAFDVVPHNHLFTKLACYGIHNKTHAWISGFLKHRTQRVHVSGEKSPWCDVISGVPQGTVLGPLLFLAYINDLPDNIQSSVRLFADDCVIYREIKNDLDAQALQEDLDTLGRWEQTWLMKFNTSKCFIMKLTHARSTKPHSYTLGGAILAETGSHSYLGVCINNKLSWNQHIQEITAKANRTLGFIKRNLHSCNKATKEVAYKSLVRPKLEYSSAVWDPYTKKT